MDTAKLLEEWLNSNDKLEIEASFLAYMLFYCTKNENGIQDLVQLLDSFWEKGDIVCKKKCIRLLAEIVTPSQSSLESSTVNMITTSLCKDKFQEASLASYFIDIMSVLMHTDTIDITSMIQLCQVLFTELSIKKLPQQSRSKVLLALGKAIEKYASELQRSKVSFIEGFIHCMDGEKDPRNLIVAFALVRAIIEKFDISRHVEDLFDVVFCYFPIHFAAPSHQDGLEITTEDLKQGLRQCLAASPYFAYYATPLLIEKLLTTTGSAKKDTMETISLCAPAYGAHAILPHTQELYDVLTKEVYTGTDPGMVEVALATIHHVVATLGTGISIANIRDPVEKSIDTLLSQCIEKMKEPELKNAKSAALILRAVASASDPACTSVTHAVLPIIYQQYSPSDSSFRQKAILSILTELLIASKKLYGSVEDIGYDRDFQTPMLMYKQQILQIFVLSLIDSDSTLRQTSLKGIHEMVLMKQFLNREEVHVTVSHLTRQLEGEDKVIRELSLQTLNVISKLYLDSIVKHTVPALLEELADQEHVVGKYQDALQAIEMLAVQPNLFKVMIDSLLIKLDYACSHLGRENPLYCQELVSCILAIYRATCKETVQIGYTTLLPFILRGCVLSVLQEKWELNQDLMDAFAMVLALTMRYLTLSDQHTLVEKMCQLFIGGIYENQRYEALAISSKEHNSRIVLLFTAIIGNCNKKVQLPLTYSTPIFDCILSAALESEIPDVTLAKTLAVIVNKWTTDAILETIYKTVQNQLLPMLGEDNVYKKKLCLNIFIWLIKALVMRGHPYGFELLDSIIIQQCGSPDIGEDAANCFTTLLHDDGFVLSKSSHANLSILYKQRVFNHCFNTLIRKSELTEPSYSESQANYLLALLYLLQNVPIQATINELPKLMMPIIVSLSSHHMNLIVLTLKVTEGIIPDAQAMVAQHLGSFIHALLRLTCFPTVDIRLLALNGLLALAQKGKSDILSPFRPSVVKELAGALDDKKRIVRKQAVDCRERWIAIAK
ncbi:RNAPII transcription regulator C-terminal-domain-containing protein [Sporodiniella umbellata]|nr:RNAPII transcription regulator C-terminal-domain-containing protein [Sporodiniella umbellata]